MTATHARAAGAIDTKSRESPGAKILRKHCARHRGDATMTLNELRPGHQRIADIYGLPVNIVRALSMANSPLGSGNQGPLERRAVR